ncbi:hypothetical protein RB594_006626 [Gaeumannomyces avenae]
MPFLHALLLLGGLANAVDLTKYVFTDTGSVGGGNTFPGVSEPFGMVKLGPDLFTGGDSYSGYQPNGDFLGFSMLHLSGTGGAPKYGVVAQMPVPGKVENPLGNHKTGRETADVTEVGYYRSKLKTGVTVELAASSRAGMYQYTFPSDPKPRNVIVDVSHVLPSFRGMGLGQHYLGGKIEVDKDGSGQTRYRGQGSYDNGWNRSPKWTVYFCGVFNESATFKTFLGDSAAGETLSQYSDASKVEHATNRLGAVFTFDAAAVSSRVGVSFISEDKACRNLQDQVPAGTRLLELRDKTRDIWNSQVLSKVTANDKNEDNLRRLYTSMYFMHLMPTNKTGENPKWDSLEPYYDDVFTLWDLFRCTTALFHVFQPSMYEDWIRSMIDTWRHDGYVSDARSSFFNGAVQGGSNSDTVFADAFIKGVRGRINWDDGYAAMVKNAEVQPPNNGDPRDNSSSTREGRGALPDWLKHGYVTTKYARSVTRAVEYAGNDFGLYQVAKGLGKTKDAEKYLGRSRQWRNHWNTNMKSHGFVGFLGPIGEGGAFLEQDPMSCNGCYWGDHYYQALPWEYSMNAHHDIDQLIKLSAGPETFVRRLETIFQPNVREHGHEQFDKMIFNPGNEPSFTTPFLFNFVGRQDLSVNTSRHIGKKFYGVRPNGLPGNSDAGAMESWILWVMLGLYPLTGQTTFLIGSPWLEDVTISLGGSKSLRIRSTGGSEGAYYVQSLKVNGNDWDRAWLTWDDVFASGGTLDFVLGPEPSAWARDAKPPPSPASESYVYDPATEGPRPQQQGGGGSTRPAWVTPVASALGAAAFVGIAAWGVVLGLRRRRARKSREVLAAAGRGRSMSGGPAEATLVFGPGAESSSSASSSPSPSHSAKQSLDAPVGGGGVIARPVPEP